MLKYVFDKVGKGGGELTGIKRNSDEVLVTRAKGGKKQGGRMDLLMGWIGNNLIPTSQ